MSMVTGLVERPLMTNDWSRVVKNLKVAEKGHVRYAKKAEKVAEKVAEKGHVGSADRRFRPSF